MENRNKEIASLFYRIADALEIKGETGFKVVAYQRAARILEDLTQDVAELVASGKLADIPGIGKGMAEKIEEYLKTGRIKRYEEVMRDVPESLLQLLEIPGLGGRTIHLMNKELKVKNLDDLKRVIKDGSLEKLYGMGKKKVENIKKGIELTEQAHERMSICDALIIAEEVMDYLKEAPGINHISPAGSLRRMKETVGDIDILATGKDGPAIIKHFVKHPRTINILAEGDTKGSILIETEMGERQVDLRIVEEDAYGAALQYFTGSKAHNIKLRGLAKDRGLKISEYGVFKGEKKIAGRTEEEVYKVFGLPVIPPEMREDRGEIELALEGKLPEIIELKDIRGDLHVHSNWSDGVLTLEEIVEHGKKMGYSYIAVCDHSQSAKYAHGLTPERLAEQIKEIDKINARLKGFRLLKGTEADILADGSIDFPESLLRKLDLVVASIHSGFKKNVTERIISAIKNPLVQVIGHPTGRLISGREGYEVDIDKVIAAAAQYGKFLELNAYYDRLDLDEHNLKKAREKGVPIAIGTDTHYAHGFAMMRFGLGIARRAWLTRKDVINTLTVDRLLKIIRK
ncbi:MAG: DNA polymerase/3'-5' exonuclease PolX [Candidatus Saccharicenans sp.]|nr:DNA polymerase/3'-5' exonuclease PolX [Candidatus Saccharicenans sp.]MDI6848872.1 DNA polymerase/3'-5' exonuclease PolX [Candidatus Saccharicenans sp.]